jgi:hypothetical protein
MTAKRYMGVVVWCGMMMAATAAFGDGPLNAGSSMANNLRSLLAAKKAVTVVLKGGESYTARIGQVGDHYVLLSELSGKEFFDALVAIDEIAALEVRVRDR